MYKIETRKDTIKLVRSILEAIVLIALLVLAIRALTVSKAYCPYDPIDPAVVSGQDEGFLVVSYFGVDRQGTNTLISTKQLDEQLSNLHELGYVTISQQDILNYYQKGTPLPDKALFLMFEDGRRDTALFASKILEKYNYKATILSYADNIEEPDPKFLSAKDLKELTETGFWELGTNGYRLEYINCYDRYDRFLGGMVSDEYVRVTQYLGRDYNHYLMDFIRDEDQVPVESTVAMRSRITQDYRYMEQIYTENLGMVPALYCLMHSNTGRYGNNALVSQVNAENLEDLFEMNFNRDGYALNTTASSLYDLTRLQPQAYWSTNHLLMRIWGDLPADQKEKITFTEGEAQLAQQHSAYWTLLKGAAEYKKDHIILTSLPQGEGILALRQGGVADASVSVQLQGNKVGCQTIYLRTDEAFDRYVAVALYNNELVITEKADDVTSTLFTLDLHELVPVDERVSVEEDERASLVAEYTMRGRFADSAADSLVFYNAANQAKQTDARSVTEGAEEYVAELQINTPGDTALEIQLAGDTIRVLVDGEDVTGAVNVSVQDEGGVALGASWGGWGYSQRNVADDVYDGVFRDLVISTTDTTLYDGRLHGLEKVLDVLGNAFNTVLNWFIVNL